MPFGVYYIMSFNSSFLNIIKVVELRRMNWEGHVERKWTGEMHTELKSGNLEGRDYLNTYTYDDIIKRFLET